MWKSIQILCYGYCSEGGGSNRLWEHSISIVCRIVEYTTVDRQAMQASSPCAQGDNTYTFYVFAASVKLRKKLESNFYASNTPTLWPTFLVAYRFCWYSIRSPLYLFFYFEFNRNQFVLSQKLLEAIGPHLLKYLEQIKFSNCPVLWYHPSQIQIR